MSSWLVVWRCWPRAVAATLVAADLEVDGLLVEISRRVCSDRLPATTTARRRASEQLRWAPAWSARGLPGAGSATARESAGAVGETGAASARSVSGE